MPGATRELRRTLAPAILVAAGWLAQAASPLTAAASPQTDAQRADSLALRAAAVLGQSSTTPALADAPSQSVAPAAQSRADSTPEAPAAPAAAAPAPASSTPVAALAAAMDGGMQTLLPTVSPACSVSAFKQVGDASWYGPDFHGQPTASGETFDALALTVAHPSLPLGAVVEIKNLENGRSTFARVNDRGPFLKDRIVDCSFAVAHMLGFVAQGLARVQVTVLDSLAVVPPLLPGANVAMAAMEHLPPLRLANALVSRTAARVPLPPAGAPLAVAAASSTDVRRATVVGTMTRKASVLPFPAIVQIYRHLLHLVMGPYGEWDPARGARAKLETFGLRDFVHLFTD